MNCATAQELMSAFHDGELDPEQHAQLAAHVDGCAECARILAEYGELSRMAAELRTPVVPEGAWGHLESKLDEMSPTRRPRPSGVTTERRRLSALALAAALILVMISVGLLVRWNNSGEHDHERAALIANFGHYLRQFKQDPDQAQQVLLANYDGRAVELDEAARAVRYRPVAPETLPNGLVRDRVYLLKMPCCLCTQAIYRDQSGSRLAVFEHVDDQPVWFGDRPVISTQCQGVPTSLVQVDDCLAATWKRQGRFITVIGLRDVDEVSRVVASFNEATDRR